MPTWYERGRAGVAGRLIAGLLASAAWLAAAGAAPQDVAKAGRTAAAAATKGPDFKGEKAHPVGYVVDGDTVMVSVGGSMTKVRLIGVDTPETVHPNKPVERYGREASKFLKDLLRGRSVYLRYEASGSRTDRYGRTLAYLYLEGDGLFVNREIVARGYGHAYTKYPFAYVEDFRAAESEARESKRGLWGPTPAVVEAAEKVDVSTERCGFFLKGGKSCRKLVKGGGYCYQHLKKSLNVVDDGDSSGPSGAGDSAPPGGRVNVRGYTRKDGTSVAPHTRSAPRSRR